MYVNAWYTNESRPYEHSAIGETREKDKEEKDERVANASLIHKDQRDRVNCTHVKCMVPQMSLATGDGPLASCLICRSDNAH